jgi:hypothetical protein
MIKILLLVVVCVVVGVAAYFIFFNKPSVSLPGITANAATISGMIDLNGLPPAGATITISSRESEKGEFKPFVQNVQAADMANWEWKGAKVGVNYDLRADVVVNGQVVATSQTLEVTAPATEEQLTINFKSSKAVTNSPAPSTQPQQSKISGTYDINGYLPQGTTLTLMQKQTGAASFTQVGTPLSATDQSQWSWDEALTNTEYQLQAVLKSNGITIGQSQVLTVTAPAANEALVINSNAQPPATPTPAASGASASPSSSGNTISGNINFNGVAPQNSGIVILQSIAGQNNYSVAVTGINPVNGSQWSWTGAQPGVSYQLMAVLKQTNSNNTQTDIATSQSIITTAPASNEMFTLNSSVSLPAPQGTVTVSCGTKNSGANNWAATISYPSQSGANGYWLQLGSTNGGNDIVNVTNNAQSGNNQTVNATLNDSVWYYARYAYTYTANPTSGSGFSSFSGSFQLMCP